MGALLWLTPRVPQGAGSDTPWLSYRSIWKIWWAEQGSNLRPRPC